MRKPCFECGKPSAHKHHVVPKSQGGTKTVPLCETCHGKAHNRRFTNHVSATKAGLERRRAQGLPLGRPTSVNPKTVKKIKQMRESGLSLRAIADELNETSTPTAHGGKSWYPSTVRLMLQ